MNKQSQFSHVPNFTDYMKITVQVVSDFFDKDLSNKKILDIPAGNGLVSKAFDKLGGDVISADINNEFPHFRIVIIQFHT